jgi:hypothetical protein
MLLINIHRSQSIGGGGFFYKLLKNEKDLTLINKHKIPHFLKV